MIGSATVTAKQASQTIPQLPGVVFVVDDDVSVRKSVDHLITCAGWRVEAFANAGEFLSRRQVDAPSCLILDIKLPDCSGLDLQRQMRESGLEMPTVFI